MFYFSHAIEFKEIDSEETFAILFTGATSELRDEFNTRITSIFREQLEIRNTSNDENGEIEPFESTHYQTWARYKEMVRTYPHCVVCSAFAQGEDGLSQQKEDLRLGGLNNESRKRIPKESNELEEDRGSYTRLQSDLGEFFEYLIEVVSTISI